MGALFPPRVDTTPDLLAAERAIESDAWAAEVVRRALSCEGMGTYKLGAGGRDPSTPTPLDAAGRCDCSGFVAWAWGEPRYDPADGVDEIGGDWIYTDALERDALGPKRFARKVEVSDVRPGDVLVYGAGAKVGHCGVVVGVRLGGARTLDDVTVIHCHSGKAPAISRSSGALWRRKGGIAIRRVGH